MSLGRLGTFPKSDFFEASENYFFAIILSQNKVQVACASNPSAVL
jgi:hypothetical protein